MSTSKGLASVWDAIEDTPQEAASMKARSDLMIELRLVIEERGLTQNEAAALFGVAQPRISDLMRGKINLFSLGTLMDMSRHRQHVPCRQGVQVQAAAPHDRRRCASQGKARPDSAGRLSTMTTTDANMASMFNPPYPGLTLRDDVLPFPSVPAA